MSLKVAGIHSPLRKVTVHILIVHTEYIINFLLCVYRSRITENNGTSRVCCLHPVPTKLKVSTIHTLITDTPKQNRRMRAETLHHLLTLSQITVSIFGIALRFTGSIIFLPISIYKTDSSLTLDIHPITVTVFQESFRRRIVRRTYKVHVRFFEQKYIKAVQFSGSGSSQSGMNIMPAGSAQFHRLSVHQHTITCYFNFTKSHFTDKTADFFPILQKYNSQGI